MDDKPNIKTLRVRVKDRHKPVLEQMAFEVNQVWNAANAITAEYACIPMPEVGWIRTHFTAFELQKLLKGIKKPQG